MVVLGVLVGSACSSQPPRSDVQPVPVLQTTPAVTGTVRPGETLSGIIAPLQNVQISNTLAEPVASVRVQEGQVVQHGQVLAVLETQDLEANLKAAQKIYDEDVAKISQTRYQGVLAIAQGNDQGRSAQGALSQGQANLVTGPEPVHT